jgi:hypothetical protein
MKSNWFDLSGNNYNGRYLWLTNEEKAVLTEIMAFEETIITEFLGIQNLLNEDSLISAASSLGFSMM